MRKTPRRDTPPQWIRKLLSLFLDDRMLESSLGDLEEKYALLLKNNKPLWKAKMFYTFEGLGFLKMARLRKKNTSTQTTLNMISHTLLFFTRLVRRDKSYYLVSLAGLTLSLASFIFIAMFISDELAYDTFHVHKDRIFRVTTHLRLNDVDYNQATSQFPMASALESELKNVKHAIRIYPQLQILESGERKIQEKVIFADERFLEIFSFPLVYGDKRVAMNHPGNIILTEATSKKYFGTANPLGETLLMSGQPLIVTGVMEDLPEQTHLKFDAVIPLAWQLNQWRSESGLEGRENKWFWTGAYTYVMLDKMASAEKVQSDLSLIVNKYFPARYKEGGRLVLQPLTDIHLKSSLDAELEPGGSMLYLRLFFIVACVILIVSTINLVNLSYFKIASRVREVGIRKFLGQNSGRVIAQLSLESIITGVVAFLLAVVTCQLFLTSFNILLQKNLKFWSPSNLLITGATFVLIVLVCLIAVLRPALRYATKPASYLLLGSSGKSSAANKVRNVLIGMQVCFSFVLLAFSFVISSQIDLFKHKDLGYDKENIIVVNVNQELTQNFEAFKTEVKKHRDVIEVTRGEIPMGYNAWRFVPEGGSYEKPLMLPFTSFDYSFLPAMNIKLLMGENFEPGNHYDSLWPFIINQRAAMELGWLDDPLGRTLEIFAPGTTDIMAKGKVIGLIQDYHFESLHQPVKPVVITVDPYSGPALIKVSGTNIENAITGIGMTWKQFSDKPYEYEVLETKLNNLYSNENKLANVIQFFTVIALYLTCYGLFAMSSLLFSSRLKEVAIRKVFGADQLSIVKGLYTRYFAFNLIAIIVGLPIAVFLGNLWLQTFQFRIELTSSFFIKAAICVLIAGLISVSYYLFRVSFSNPVKFLRRE